LPFGYTLVELTVVLFIIGLVFSLSLPKLGNFLFQSDLKDVTRSLKAAVHLLRSKSITMHRPTVLHIDLDRNLFWGTFTERELLGQRGQGNPPLIPAKQLPQGIRFMDASNINTPKKNSGLVSSVFTAKGTLEETVIHLVDVNKKVMTIIVNAYTGRFSIFDEYVEVEYGRPSQ